MQQLLDIMQALRNKETGCPWDIAQDFQSLAPYVIEEAYEVVDAIERQDYRELKSELGDLLLQVVFHAQLAKEQGLFDFEDVIASINQKMISRHPHVFGDAIIKTQAEQTISWEQIKKLERAEKDMGDSSALAGLSQGMPETIRALKLQKKLRQWDLIGPMSMGFSISSMKKLLRYVLNLILVLDTTHCRMKSGIYCLSV